MRAIYNGVDLMPLETHYFNWEPVYDDSQTDYLYTRVSMATRSVVNGLSSVLDITNGPPVNYGFAEEVSLGSPTPVLREKPTTTPPTNVIVPGGGTVPTVPPGFGLKARNNSTYREIIRNPNVGGGPNGTHATHAAIRHRLSVPRGKLYIFWGSGMESGTPLAGKLTPPSTEQARLFLESPLPSTRCDCKNGPFPKLLGVTEAFGDATTLLVDWAVETFVNEASDNNVRTPGALLSNRFSQSHEVIETGYTVITTEGTAIFRTDFVYPSTESPDGHSPDEDRPFIFMPIPQGFTRKILYVRGRPDVTGVDYAYQDKQEAVNFVAGPYVKASSIVALHRQAISTKVDLTGSVLGAYERVLSINANRAMSRIQAGDLAHRETTREKVNRALSEWEASRKKP